MNEATDVVESDSSLRKPRWTEIVVLIVFAVFVISLGSWVGYVNLLPKQYHSVSEEAGLPANEKTG